VLARRTQPCIDLANALLPWMGRLSTRAHPRQGFIQQYSVAAVDKNTIPSSAVRKRAGLRSSRDLWTIRHQNQQNGDEVAGYLMPQPDIGAGFGGSPEEFPEDWVEQTPAGPRLKSDRRKLQPIKYEVLPHGSEGSPGRTVWFSPGKFRFCPICCDQPPQQARERNKFAGLSAEGRSSVTTLLVSSVFRWLNEQGAAVLEVRRKILGFTDNRQDAALQAGHFNDLLFVTLLRAGTLAAVRVCGDEGLAPDEFGRLTAKALGFTS
jgi:hypothetical protein